MRGIEEDEKGRAIKSKRIEEGKRKRREARRPGIIAIIAGW